MWFFFNLNFFLSFLLYSNVYIIRNLIFIQFRKHEKYVEASISYFFCNQVGENDVLNSEGLNYSDFSHQQ